MAAGAAVLPHGPRQTGSGKAGERQRAQTESGGSSAGRGHGGGSLSLGIGHRDMRQYRSEGSACRGQDEFVFGSQRDHEEGVS